MSPWQLELDVSKVVFAGTTKLERGHSNAFPEDEEGVPCIAAAGTVERAPVFDKKAPGVPGLPLATPHTCTVDLLGGGHHEVGERDWTGTVRRGLVERDDRAGEVTSLDDRAAFDACGVGSNGVDEDRQSLRDTVPSHPSNATKEHARATRRFINAFVAERTSTAFTLMGLTGTAQAV